MIGLNPVLSGAGLRMPFATIPVSNRSGVSPKGLAQGGAHVRPRGAEAGGW